MSEKIEVETLQFHRLKNAVDDMQGHVFFCQDENGALRRWFPPRPYKVEADEEAG